MRAFALLALLAGCSSSPAVPMTFKEINSQILNKSCANFTSCHCSSALTGCNNPGGAAVDKLDLMTDPYNALVNAPSYNAQAKAMGLLRVKPGDPANSFLVIKLMLPLAATDDGGYQSSMPYGNPHLPDVDITAIENWITAGAPNN